MNSIKNIISLWLMVGLLNFCFSQDEQIDRPPNINDVQGIWVFNDGSYFDYMYIKDNIRLDISYFKNNQSSFLSSKPNGYIGFLNNHNEDIPKNIKNLGTEGFYAVEFDYPTDTNGNFKDTPLVRQFTYNGLGTDGEMEKVDGYPNFIGFVNGRGQWEIYNQIPYIPIHVLVALKKNNPKDYEFLIKFLDIDFKTITVQKSIIHSAPNQPTKMYLIKGDEVEFLEENSEWYKMRFYGKKTIEGWIRKSDVK